jgi:cytochrome c-type biogenesis protein CcmH
MIWFWIIAGLLVSAALIALLRPLLRGGEGADQSESVVTIFQRELANIDSEVAQGRLAPEEAEQSRAEVTRRMLSAADRESQDARLTTGRTTEISWRISTAAGIAALLPVAALAVYFAVGTPAAIDPTKARDAGASKVGPHDMTELAAAADQLKARLQREPEHVEGWILLGRTLTSLGRFAEARDAYGRAVALAPNEPRLHAELGEALVLAAGGAVPPEAEAEFKKSGNDPRARFYSAEAALQRGDKETATAALRALLADAPADAPWRQAVAERLTEIEPGERPLGANAPEASPRPSGPSAQDVAAAQAMSPEQRQAIIRGMVDRLAARLEQNPDDKEGWTRLARAYDVLGETDKAQAARARAAAAPSVPPEQALPPRK